MGEMLPGTREMRALEAAATRAIERMEQLFGNGAVAGGDAHGYRAQMKAMTAQVRRLADVFARADAAHGEAYPVYTVDVLIPENGARGRSQPPTQEFRSWEDALAFLAGVEFFDTVTVQSGMRRGDGPAAGTPLAPAPARPGGEPGRTGGTPPPPPAVDAFLGAFVTVFAFSSTLLPTACPACPHAPADHIYIAEFTSFTLPGGITGVLPTHGVVTCRLDACTGTWDLSVLDGVDTLLISPGDGTP